MVSLTVRRNLEHNTTVVTIQFSYRHEDCCVLLFAEKPDDVTLDMVVKRLQIERWGKKQGEGVVLPDTRRDIRIPKE
jgi:hypothetical protein